MKKIRIFWLILSVVAMAAFFTACSNPAAPDDNDSYNVGGNTGGGGNGGNNSNGNDTHIPVPPVTNPDLIAPTKVTVIANGALEITVSWTAAVQDSEITNYYHAVMFRLAQTDQWKYAHGFALEDNFTGNSANFSPTGISRHYTTVYVYVYVHDGTGAEGIGPGTQSYGRTANVWVQPGALTASSVTSDAITVAWPAVTQPPEVGSYQYRLMHRVAGSGSTFTTLNNITSPHTITGLLHDTLYEFVLQAFTPGFPDHSPDRTGSFTTNAPPVAVLQAPQITAAAASGSDGINVTWTSPAQPVANHQYRLERSPTGVDNTWELVANVSSDSNPTRTYRAAWTGLKYNMTSHFRVRAFLGTNYSVWSNVEFGQTEVYIPDTGSWDPPEDIVIVDIPPQLVTLPERVAYVLGQAAPGGEYMITIDTQQDLTGVLNIPARPPGEENITVILKGVTDGITINSLAGTFIDVYSGNNLVLHNLDLRRPEGTGIGIIVRAGANIDMINSTISGNTNRAVTIMGGTFNMFTGAVLTGNSGGHGGGVAFITAEGGILNMFDNASIHGNTGNTSGGGVAFTVGQGTINLLGNENAQPRIGLNTGPNNVGFFAGAGSVINVYRGAIELSTGGNSVGTPGTIGTPPPSVNIRRINADGTLHTDLGTVSGAGSNFAGGAISFGITP